ncbi:MAG: hypothetical protein NT006_03780 [Candidatus Aminicenantes bacterium]|nr:hypothetical protein [Candidatus Aminicenantes bacterium]
MKIAGTSARRTGAAPRFISSIRSLGSALAPLQEHFPNDQRCRSKAKQPESDQHPSERKHRQGPDGAARQRPQERPANPTLATLREALSDKHAQAETGGCDDRSGEHDCE